MNPFQAHAENMAAYEEVLAEPVPGVTSPAPSIEGEVFTANGAVASDVYPATVGHFILEQVLVPGGFSPRLMGQAIVRKAVLPAGAFFKTGRKFTVCQVGGSVRRCQVESIEDTFTEWRLNLWDQSQGA